MKIFSIEIEITDAGDKYVFTDEISVSSNTVLGGDAWDRVCAIGDVIFFYRQSTGAGLLTSLNEDGQLIDVGVFPDRTFDAYWTAISAIT